jgi:CSLREA domain-containing protein
MLTSSKTLPLPQTLLGALLLGAAASSQAAVLLVTTTADSYDGQCNLQCSLRDAVAVANQSASADTILLPSGTYVLSRLDPLDEQNRPLDDDDNLVGDLDISGELRIKGAGPGKSIISGSTDDLFAVKHRLLEVRPDARLVLERLTLKNGRIAGKGGAVENHSQLQLRDVWAQNNIARALDILDDPDNEAASSGRGGAIANYGDLAVSASRFQDNDVVGVFWNNNSGLGGALYNLGSLVVRDSHFLSNSASDQSDAGAGAALYNKGQTTVERSSFVGNSASEIFEGGAITNDGGTLRLTNSTLSGNTGALTNGPYDTPSKPRSRAILINATLTGNVADIDNRYAVMNWGELLIRNSLIAGNSLLTDIPINCQNLGSNFSYQAIGLLRNDEPSNCGADLFVPFEQTFTQVLSSALTSDGKTYFHALLPGSPAVDAGIGDCIAQDQRGVSRPQDGNGDDVAVCDLGAYELKPQ